MNDLLLSLFFASRHFSIECVSYSTNTDERKSEKKKEEERVTYVVRRHKPFSRTHLCLMVNLALFLCSISVDGIQFGVISVLKR